MLGVIFVCPLFQKNYLHRFVYVFEYTKPNPDFAIYEIIGEIIKRGNENFCDEPLTGVLLYYQCYGVNMIEVCINRVLIIIKL